MLSLNEHPKLKICAITKLKINAAFETREGWYQYAVKTWLAICITSGKQDKLEAAPYTWLKGAKN